jgi:hypothetical protein
MALTKATLLELAKKWERESLPVNSPAFDCDASGAAEEGRFWGRCSQLKDCALQLTALINVLAED